MSQIIQRQSRSSFAALGTLADNTYQDMVTTYGTALKERIVLFAMMASCWVLGIEISEAMNLKFVLVDQDLTAAELDATLDLILDKDQPQDYAEHQRLKAVGEIVQMQDTQSSGSSSGAGNIRYNLEFKSPRGVPYDETNGWKLALINRSGSALTTGAQAIVDRAKYRFAYVR